MQGVTRAELAPGVSTLPELEEVDATAMEPWFP